MGEIELSKREMEILLLAAEGMTDKEIAGKLGIARSTVITHWTRMRERLGASNRGHIIARAMVTIYRDSQREVERLGAVYRSMVECLEDFAVFLFDKDRKILSWNPGVERNLGYTEQEFLALRAEVIYTPEDRKAGVPEREQEIAAKEGKAMDERWHLKKSGERFWSQGVVMPIRLEGEITCFAKILRDLTHLKRLEEQVLALGGNPVE
jgi:two-component system CheB/CheR fusion protein